MSEIAWVFLLIILDGHVTTHIKWPSEGAQALLECRVSADRFNAEHLSGVHTGVCVAVKPMHVPEIGSKIADGKVVTRQIKRGGI